MDFDDPWRIDPVMAERADEGERLPMPERSAGFEPLVFRTPAPERRHIGLHPRLVDENEAFWINAVLMLFPTRSSPRDIGTVLLSRQDRF
jgi:hypothetical protein